LDNVTAFKSCLFIQSVGIVVVLICLPAQCILNNNKFANYHFFRSESQAEILERSRLASSAGANSTSDDYER